MNRRDVLKFIGLAPVAGAAAVITPDIAAAAAAPVVDTAEIARLNNLIGFHVAARDAEARAFAEALDFPGAHRVIKMSLKSSGDHPAVADTRKQLEES